ncbi:MAG TPA: 3-dehydroquinate synthase, partial [Candidatus Methylomirabilis sp.]|nr:3-dehydroquinate synthase [Candidatus Methylomirabilis sp.]
MDTIRVNLSNRSYDIHVGAGLLQQLGDFIRPLKLGRHLGVVTHPELATPYASAVAESLRRAGHEVSLLTVPPGEESKSLEQ